MKHILIGLGLAAGLVAAAEAASSSWGDQRHPLSGAARVIGGPAAGCVAGAQALPLDGPGYEVIRVSRNRFYGHPDTVAFLQRLGKAAQATGLPTFYVGDMSQPRGGPMVSGHGSHQTGLDADVWFNLDPKPKLTPWARENVPLPSMVRDDQSWVDQHRFTEKQVTLLKLAATDPRVDRIFVHPTIKAALCERPGDHSWLRKLRPWRGHDEHFHVRLSCPASSPDCVPQAPVPPGDGCDSTLDWWLDHPSPRPPATPVVHRGPSPRLPAQCRAVLGRR